MIRKFEDFIQDFNFKVDLNEEMPDGSVIPDDIDKGSNKGTDSSSSDINTFGEYRKGSTKYGGLVTKMMDWLRLKREQSKKELTNLTVNFDDFVSETNIQIKELENFIKDKISKGLYNFEILINYNDRTIFFKDIIKKSNNMLSEN